MLNLFFSSDIKIRNTDPLDLPLTQLQWQMNVYRNPVGFGGSISMLVPRDPSVVSRLRIQVLALSNLEVVGQIRTPIEYLVELLRTEVGWFPPGVPPLPPPKNAMVFVHPRSIAGLGFYESQVSPKSEALLLWGLIFLGGEALGKIPF